MSFESFFAVFLQKQGEIMLIEFKVANYRSFREEQTLSFVASNTDKGVLPENLIDLPLPGMSGLSYLKSIALFGPNASGKSNLLLAFKNLCSFAANSSSIGVAPIPVEPFKLDADSKKCPTSFEITFVTEGIRYLFGLSVFQERVTEEYLIAYPKGLPQQWYHRHWDADKKEYDWDFKASFKKGRAALEKTTRPDATFLSTGAQFEHEQLKTVRTWFEKIASILYVGEEGLLNLTAQLLDASVIDRKDVLALLQAADLGISDIRIKKEIVEGGTPNKYRTQFSTYGPSGDYHTDYHIDYQPSFHHSGWQLPVVMKHQEESQGTLNYFSILGPCLAALKHSRFEMIDELDASLHPQLAEALIRFFNKQSKTSQLLFTTHNPFLLGNKVLRRDQVWFTEKDKTGASKLFPLTDFSPRKDEARVKAYMSGRYGAVPFLEEVLQ